MTRAVNPHGRDRAAEIRRLAGTSVDVIRSAQSSSGAYPAAVSFAPYAFSWFRDGAFVAEGMSTAGAALADTGAVDSARAFHRWCARVLQRESPAVDELVARIAAGEQPADADLLPARYTLAGDRHLDDWWNYQVDGYGTWLWALHRHLRRCDDDPAPYAAAVATAVRYLLAVGDRPCRDWWEEHRDEVHVSTLACVYAGLGAAAAGGLLPDDLAGEAAAKAGSVAELVRTDGVHAAGLRKWLGSTQVDATLVVAGWPFGIYTPGDAVMTTTVDRIEAELTSPDGGVHRYAADTFYGGGQWPILAAFLGLHHVAVGDRDRAFALLAWIAGTADADDHLPEQVPPLLYPDRLAEWTERWGDSARPLLWSHGMFLLLAAALDHLSPSL